MCSFKWNEEESAVPSCPSIFKRKTKRRCATWGLPCCMHVLARLFWRLQSENFRSIEFHCREMIKAARLASRGICLCRSQASRNSYRPYHISRTVLAPVPSKAVSGHCKYLANPRSCNFTIRRATTCRAATMEADTSASTNPLLTVRSMSRSQQFMGAYNLLYTYSSYFIPLLQKK